MLEVVLAVAVFAVAAAIVRQAAADACYDLSDGERHPHKWGYTDTRFEFDGPKTVRVTGSRYPLAGFTMPHFIPFVEEMLQVPIDPDEMAVEKEAHAVPPSRAGDSLVAAWQDALGAERVSLDDEERLIHSHGQLSVDEVYRLLYGDALERVVDLVLYPESEDHVRTIVRLASEDNVCLVPYGGGTNVSGALALPTDDDRVFASVDMRRMNRIVDLDEDNLQACIEAGISGKELERELAARGYTVGHDPDSIELSTLGGWIATNASGMKKNRYGNIEDIVLEATLVTPTGAVETCTPRRATRPASSRAGCFLARRAISASSPRPCSRSIPYQKCANTVRWCSSPSPKAWSTYRPYARPGLCRRVSAWSTTKNFASDRPSRPRPLP